MSLLVQDLRYAVRMLVKSPVVTAMTVLMLALGIGANTAIFSVVNGALLRPLSFPEPDRVMQVIRSYPTAEYASASITRFAFWRANNDVFENITAYELLGSGFNLVGDGVPERVVGSRVTAEFFSVFGVEPVLGRDFVDEDDQPGAPRVVVISDGLWRRRFGGDRLILGTDIILNNEPYSVIGIAPPSLRHPYQAELWTPLRLDVLARERSNYLNVTGRLRDGLSLEAASASMALLGPRHHAADPEIIGEGEHLMLRPFAEHLYGHLRTSLLVLLGAVGFVLLIACVNVANLQLARSAARRKEIAIRTVLGAKTSRIVQQLLTESMLLAVVAGLVGLLLAYWLIPTLVALGPASVRELPNIRIDGFVVLFALAISLVTGVLFGLMPAFQAAASDLNDPLKEGSTRSTGGHGRSVTRRLLVMSEVALALILMIGAALLTKSFAGLRDTDPGFRTDHLLTMKLALPETKYGDVGAMDLFNRQILDQIERIPSVDRAAMVTSLPFGPGPDMPFIINARYVEGSDTEGVGEAQHRAVSTRFFGALQIPVRQGRDFTERDTTGAPLVVIINESMAARYWPNEDPIGQRITIGPPYVPELADPTPREIVGVVGDVREIGLGAAPPDILYVPAAQMPQAMVIRFVRLLPESLVIRTRVAPTSLTGAIQKAIWTVDPKQPVSNVLTMDEIVSRSIGSAQFNMLLLGLLSGLALVLAAVGIYGVLSYLVGQRTREIGIRVALGATAHDVLRMVIGQGMVPVLAGVGIGLAGAFALTRLLASLLYGVSPLDPATFATAPLLLIAVALAATYLPARRASAMDPASALRHE